MVSERIGIWLTGVFSIIVNLASVSYLDAELVISGEKGSGILYGDGCLILYFLQESAEVRNGVNS